MSPRAGKPTPCACPAACLNVVPRTHEMKGTQLLSKKHWTHPTVHRRHTENFVAGRVGILTAGSGQHDVGGGDDGAGARGWAEALAGKFNAQGVANFSDKRGLGRGLCKDNGPLIRGLGSEILLPPNPHDHLARPANTISSFSPPPSPPVSQSSSKSKSS